MSVYHQLSDIVTIDELEKRWSFTIGQIDQVVRDGELTPFWFKDRRESNDGSAYYLCEHIFGGRLPRGEDLFDVDSYISENIVFSLDEVTSYEAKHTYLKDKVVPLDNKTVQHGNIIQDGWISGSDLQGLLKLSPGQFVEFVHGNNLVAYWEDFDFGKTSLYEYKKENGRMFNLNAICDSRFHIADLRAKAIELPQLAAVLPGESSPHPQRGDDPRIIELERQLAEARQENEALAAEVDRLKAETSPSLPKTAKAMEAAQAGRVQKWKEYARVIARVAYECGQEGRRDVARSAFTAMAKKHGGLSKEALEVLRGALPEVAKTTAGAPRQG